MKTNKKIPGCKSSLTWEELAHHLHRYAVSKNFCGASTKNVPLTAKVYLLCSGSSALQRCPSQQMCKSPILRNQQLKYVSTCLFKGKGWWIFLLKAHLLKTSIHKLGTKAQTLPFWWRYSVHANMWIQTRLMHA